MTTAIGERPHNQHCRLCDPEFGGSHLCDYHSGYADGHNAGYDVGLQVGREETSRGTEDNL